MIFFYFYSLKNSLKSIFKLKLLEEFVKVRGLKMAKTAQKSERIKMAVQIQIYIKYKKSREHTNYVEFLFDNTVKTERDGGEPPVSG